ncbi:MAG: NAD(+) synthase, partial [Clostridia bacterium]|nr:NAD(+) synthase [Clostridia bacterium]
EFLSNERAKNKYLTLRNNKLVYFSIIHKFSKLDRVYSKTPFIPKENKPSRYELILKMQASALQKRIRHVNPKTLVLGVSGGLDSTLALLVAVRAMKNENRSLEDIVAITMPCFGTTSRTKNNATVLAENLGVTFKEINIKNSVLSHFNDISQNVNDLDVTYENSQARERTQVLMDYANKTGGLVLGTGDLSEMALGWATYNGDHMSMYSVNASIPKTLLRELVEYESDNLNRLAKERVIDILSTPVSPELIPPKNNEITQKTEDIVGPYILHDFYIYHALRGGFKPSKILYIAENAFKGEFDKKTLYKWLKNFYNRFFVQQFKRSCVPDGAKLGSVGLSPRGDLVMPSDASKIEWIKDLESIEI